MSAPRRLLVGLGNPGPDYALTRHNVGWQVLEAYAERLGAEDAGTKFDAKLLRHGEILLLEPLTYMNASGRAVRQAADYFKLGPSDILVVGDDIDLPFGEIRLRTTGGSAGQRGLQDILDVFSTNEIARLRIGINRPPTTMSPSDYVLSRFSDEEESRLTEVIDRAIAAIEEHWDE